MLEYGGDDCEHEEAKESWVLCDCKTKQRCSDESCLKPYMGLSLKLAKEQNGWCTDRKLLSFSCAILYAYRFCASPQYVFEATVMRDLYSYHACHTPRKRL